MSENDLKYTAIMLVTTTPAWLALSHDDRNAFNDKHVNPIFARYIDKVKVRLLDAEAFTGRCTDVILFETADLGQYYFLVEELRDTELFTKPYFIVNDIIIALEEGFVAFEAQTNRN